MFKSFAITLCKVFITQLLPFKVRACGVVWCGVVCVCVCVCVWLWVSVCVCVSIEYLMLFRQLPYLKFHNKIFATNWSQIWVFSEDLIKCILSLKNCHTVCKKGNKNYKKIIMRARSLWYKFFLSLFSIKLLASTWKTNYEESNKKKIKIALYNTGHAKKVLSLEAPKLLESKI